MPQATFDEAYMDALASAPTDVVVYSTLEFRHRSFIAPARVVADRADLSATLEPDAPRNPGEMVTFTGVMFDLVLPEVTDGGNPELRIDVDNIGRELVEQFDLAAQVAEKAEVTYRAFLSSDLTTPQYVMHLTVTSIECDVFRVHATAGFGDIVNRAFPRENYTAQRFPGLQQ